MNISYKMYDSTFALYVYPDRSADSCLNLVFLNGN
ncbi:hypothetical protein T05_11374 [Trichinella murrelli]|uniref:Uncharacterized protein n=1 Tax=Trichinella murrelli TaxID=144512 RepID=A0A0V0SUS7_9BILA|nr:hypothetical protein T05_11374 [Trichinella murrelli]